MIKEKLFKYVAPAVSYCGRSLLDSFSPWVEFWAPTTKPVSRQRAN